MRNVGLKKMTATATGLLLIFLFSSPQAKNSSAPFETLKISLNMAMNANKNIFHEYWDQSPAVDLMVEFPFYTGLIQAGFQVAHNSSVKSGVADYTSIFLYLGWGWEFVLPYRLKWYNGVQVGNYQIIYEQEEYIGHNLESELGAGIYSCIAIPVRSNWFTNISARCQKIYTHHRIHHTFVGIGIGYNSDTPRWLKRFLQ